jgi:hypothetical protein
VKKRQFCRQKLAKIAIITLAPGADEFCRKVAAKPNPKKMFLKLSNVPTTCQTRKTRVGH